MPDLDSISINNLIDSAQSIRMNNSQVIHDTIRITVPQESITPIVVNSNYSFPLFMLLGLIGLAAFIFVVFYILQKYISPFLRTIYKFKYAKLYIYRLKIIAWFIYFIYCFYSILNSHLIIGSAITVFILLLGIFYWKDIFTGIYIKFEGKLKIDDDITFDTTNGIIIDFFDRGLQLKTDSDEIILIPYSRLFFTSISKKVDKGELRSRVILFSLPENNSSNSIRKIEDVLSICPWIYAHKPTIVERITETEFSISVFVNDDFSYQKVETFLVDHLVGL